MKWSDILTLGVLLLFGMALACETAINRPNENDGDDNGGDSDADGDGDADDDDDNDDSADDDDDSGDDSDDVCDEDEIPLVRKLPKLMILEDVSGSMVEDEDGNPVPKWDQAKAALTNMSETFEAEVDIGLDIFPSESANTQRCGVDEPVIIDTRSNAANAIIDELNRIQPNGSTPLYDGQAKFLETDYAPNFTSVDANSYLLIVSDGQDTCGVNGSLFDMVDPADLANLTQRLLNERDIKTFVIGFGDGVSPAQLNAIAENGGTQFSEYLIADDQDSLENAIKSIIDTLISCTYEIEHPNEPYVDVNKVNFYYDVADEDHLIPFDDGCQVGVGWTWRNPPENTIVEFCEEACAMLQEQDIDTIIIQYGCDSIVPQ